MKEDFSLGYIVGAITTIIVIIVVFAVSPIKIKSPKKIVPEIQITINGKKIDTTYIYKIELYGK